MIYVTGDTHGDFKRVEIFCREKETIPEDILITLGDAGIKYGHPAYDISKNELLASLPITIFAIHGNHEQRPYTIESYRKSLGMEG